MQKEKNKTAWNGLMISPKKIYLYTSWLPLAMFISAYFHLGILDGWGQWAGGKVVIPALILSLIYTLVGLLIVFIQFNKVAVSKTLLFSILLSGSVILWFIARYVFLEIKVSF
jgi:hypothetical protein